MCVFNNKLNNRTQRLECYNAPIDVVRERQLNPDIFARHLRTLAKPVCLSAECDEKMHRKIEKKKTTPTEQQSGLSPLAEHMYAINRYADLPSPLRNSRQTVARIGRICG